MSSDNTIDNTEPGQENDEKKRSEGPQVPDSMNVEDSKSVPERLREDTSYVVLPGVFGIEGQEKTDSRSPEDEEGIRNGKNLLTEDADEPEIVMGTEADVTDEDLQLLGDPDQDMDMGDDELIRSEGLDDTDFDGDPLNEGKSDIFTTGEELDLPVSDGNNDPSADSMGQGDEENDYYSLDDSDDEI